jgi:GTP-binding protein HflX
VPVSALSGEGIPQLLRTIEQVLYESLVEVALEIPYQDGSVISRFHEVADVLEVVHGPEGVRMSGRILEEFAPEFEPYMVEANPADLEDSGQRLE